MNRTTSIIASVFSIFIVLLAGLAIADSITTSVRFVIPSNTAFAIAVPSNDSFISSGSTDALLFNSSLTSANGLNATTTDGVQNSTQSIFRYRNDANQNLNITLAFGSNPACSGGTIEVKVANASTGYKDSCTDLAIANQTDCVNITTTTVVIINDLPFSGADTMDIWLWSDYNTCTAGLDTTQTITHTTTVV